MGLVENIHFVFYCLKNRMKYFSSLTLLTYTFLASFFTNVLADILSDGPKRNRQIYCGACLAVAMELEWVVGTTSSKQTIETGGFRLDPNGNLVTKKVPLKRSEIHLTEIFEYICRRMGTYKEATHPDTGAINYFPSEARDGTKISTKGVAVSKDVGDSLEFACDTILEYFEDDLIKMFQKGVDEIGETLCVEMANLCTSENVTEQFWHFASAIMAGQNEREVEWRHNETVRIQEEQAEKQRRRERRAEKA